MTGRSSATLMCNGPVSGDRTSAAASKMPTRPRSPPCPSALAGLQRALSRMMCSARADQHGLQPEIAVQRVTDLRPPLREPVLLRLAGRHHDGGDGAVEARQELALPRALGVVPRPAAPGHRLVRPPQPVGEIAVLVLHAI